MNVIRIHLMTTDRLLGECLAHRLAAEPDLRVVAATKDRPDQRLDTTFEVTAGGDVAVLEADVLRDGGPSAAESLREQAPDLPLLLFNAPVSDLFLDFALKYDALGYLTREEGIDALLHGIRRVADGEPAFSQEIRPRLHFDSSTHRFRRIENRNGRSLTLRQVEVLQHLATGRSAKETAQLLGISRKTIESHKYRIMSKLGVNDRVALARYAIREGLVRP